MPLPPGRRRFLSSLAASPLLPAALAQTPPAAAPPAVEASPAPRDAVAEALTEAARRHFGDRFAAEQAEDVRLSIAENLQAAERLRALGLGNADEPVTAFSPRLRRAAAPTAARAGRTPSRP